MSVSLFALTKDAKVLEVRKTDCVGVFLPPVGFPLITQKRKRCNPGILQHSVTFH